MNDLDDFKMPYKYYGQTDMALMRQKYLGLTNIPKNPLEVRLNYSNRI